MASRKFGIVARLTTLSGMVGIALVITAAVTHVRLTEVAALSQLTGTVRVPQLARASVLELDITRMSLQLRHAMLARSEAEREAALAAITRYGDEINTVLGEFETNLTTTQGRAYLEKFKPQLARFSATGQQTMDKVKAGQTAEAFVHLADVLVPIRNEALSTLDEIRVYQQKRLTEDLSLIEGQARNTQLTNELLAAGIISLLIGMSIYLATVLRKRIRTVQSAADAVSAGDLSTRVQDNGRDEFSALVEAMGQMREKLAGLVSDVQGNAQKMAAGTQQIAQGTQELSDRTEQQANALQQAASTMDELGAAVRNNAENARQANTLAHSASTVAQEGGRAVDEVVATMQKIAESSRSVSDIVSVIDGIAFQTNILALNASVEAARAGELGRGFAVVASEVRTLAQRSADAAREIKTLIASSAQQVKEGSEVAARAGATTAQVVSSITEVSRIVTEIDAACSEQSIGVGQANDAVAQIERATQQNAALVEESTAAFEELQNQSRTLVASVGVFRIDAGSLRR